MRRGPTGVKVSNKLTEGEQVGVMDGDGKHNKRIKENQLS